MSARSNRLHEAVITLHGIVERMGQHLAAVETLPPEEIGWNMVGLAPIDLDREEAVDAALPQDLRQRA